MTVLTGQWGQGDGADWTVGTARVCSQDGRVGMGSGQWGYDGADWTVGTG